MNTEKLEQLVVSLKESLDKFTEKKTFNNRKNVRKILQEIKVSAQEMRVWILEELK